MTNSDNGHKIIHNQAEIAMYVRKAILYQITGKS